MSEDPPKDRGLAFDRINPNRNGRHLIGIKDVTGKNMQEGQSETLRLGNIEFHKEVNQVFNFTTDDGREYTWNVTGAKRLIVAEKKPSDIVIIQIASFAGSNCLENINRAYAAKLDADALMKPLIVVPFIDGYHVLIDGWHRVYKAALIGAEQLPAIIFTKADEKKIRESGVDF